MKENKMIECPNCYKLIDKFQAPDTEPRWSIFTWDEDRGKYVFCEQADSDCDTDFSRIWCGECMQTVKVNKEIDLEAMVDWD